MSKPLTSYSLLEYRIRSCIYLLEDTIVASCVESKLTGAETPIINWGQWLANDRLNPEIQGPPGISGTSSAIQALGMVDQLKYQNYITAAQNWLMDAYLDKNSCLHQRNAFQMTDKIAYWLAATSRFSKKL
jgi:hypothetical protein